MRILAWIGCSLVMWVIQAVLMSAGVTRGAMPLYVGMMCVAGAITENMGRKDDDWDTAIMALDSANLICYSYDDAALMVSASEPFAVTPRYNSCAAFLF